MSDTTKAAEVRLRQRLTVDAGDDSGL